jgi:hypothetical protein
MRVGNILARPAFVSIIYELLAACKDVYDG